MNALKLTIIGIVLFISNAVTAQVTVSIGSPPPWGLVGYAGVRYYYLPDVESYYDIQSSKFIYYQPTGWVYASSLPSRHRHYDLYNGYKIAMTGYRGNTPTVKGKRRMTMRKVKTRRIIDMRIDNLIISLN
jgi:hypothetical protein